eukprot:811312-Prorocentrum_minimum.AAC.3
MNYPRLEPGEVVSTPCAEDVAVQSKRAGRNVLSAAAFGMISRMQKGVYDPPGTDPLVRQEEEEEKAKARRLRQEEEEEKAKAMRLRQEEEEKRAAEPISRADSMSSEQLDSFPEEPTEGGLRRPPKFSKANRSTSAPITKEENEKAGKESKYTWSYVLIDLYADLQARERVKRSLGLETSMPDEEIDMEIVRHPPIKKDYSQYIKDIDEKTLDEGGDEPTSPTWTPPTWTAPRSEASLGMGITNAGDANPLCKTSAYQLSKKLSTRSRSEPIAVQWSDTLVEIREFEQDESEVGRMRDRSDEGAF